MGGLDNLVKFLGKHKREIAIATAVVGGGLFFRKGGGRLLRKGSSSLMRHLHDYIDNSSGISNAWYDVMHDNPIVVYLHGINGAVEKVVFDYGCGIVKGNEGPINDRSQAISAIQKLPIRLIISNKGRGRLTEREVSDMTGYAVPTIHVSRNASRGLQDRIKEEISRTNYDATRAIIEISDFINDCGSYGIRKAPQTVEKAVRLLIGNRRFVIKRDARDSYKSSVLAFSRSGEPITADGRAGDGICLKIVPRNDLEKIISDFHFFSAHFEGTSSFAKPYFYLDFDSEKIVLAQEYFVGLSITEINRMLNDGVSGIDRDAAKSMNASLMFKIIASYNQYQRKRIRKLEPSNIEGAKEYYERGSAQIYETIKPILSSIGFDKCRFMKASLFLYDDPDIWDSQLFVLGFDGNPGNFKARIGIEKAQPEVIKKIYISDDGSLRDARQIEGILGFYDVGGSDHYRHYGTLMANVVFSPSFANPDLSRVDEKWIRHAMDYFNQEANQRSNDLFRIFEHKTPNTLPKGAIVMSVDKILRLVYSNINAAINNEIAFANGEINMKDYAFTRRKLVENVLVEGRNLAVISMTGAIYFNEHFSSKIAYKTFCEDIGFAFQQAQTEFNADVVFRNPLAHAFSEYAKIGKCISESQKTIEGILDSVSCSLPFRVVYGSQL